MPFNPEPYPLSEAMLVWLGVFAGSLFLVVAVASLIFLATQGTSGVATVFRILAEGLRDLFQFSFKRVLALASLTFKEAVRRKALLVFVIFAILFMFAGWFMQDPGQTRADLQIKNHIAFTLRTISWLMLPVALLLACWGIPEDIKARSLHTVVTKPARRSEVVLGRMLGFVGIGTVVIGVMGAVGYIWIVRQIPPDAREQLVSRVPIYGKLTFRNRAGDEMDKGVNVGDMWDFRSFIEGATKSRAIWDFEGIDVEALRKAGDMRLGSSFEAFRTHMGDIEQSVYCQYTLVNPEHPEINASSEAFPINEFSETVTILEPVIETFDQQTQQSKDVSLFDDLIVDGKLRIEVQCVDAGQYLGMARPDFFIRMSDRNFLSGYSKSIFSIWLMMVLVVMLGVSASCFLKGPVATMLTFSLIVVGQWFRNFMETIVSYQFTGGGPIESIVRIAQHMNIQTKMDENILTITIKWIDYVIIGALWVVQHLIPDFEHFTRSTQYAPNGFDVDWQAGMQPVICITIAYFLPCLLIGFYSLKIRELESK